jgi:hypothetical protein
LRYAIFTWGGDTWKPRGTRNRPSLNVNLGVRLAYLPAMILEVLLYMYSVLSWGQVGEPYRVGQTIKDLIDAMDGALLEQDSNENTPYQAIVSELETFFEGQNISRETDPEYFDIELRDALNNRDLRAKIIRKHCIRNMSRDDALKALYKVGDGKC